jgi:ectoine hydroxylase-related dioxygenase (phytanoyl-CoA dioxygenase family)
MSLKTLSRDADGDAILRALDADGAAILSNVIEADFLARLVAELQPYIDRTPTGRDDFTGQHTQRTGALVARSPLCRELVMHERILNTAQTFLAPYAERIVLHLTQTIRIHPRQGSQTLHRDRLAWGPHLPATLEPQLNTMWALTDFTFENGATRVVPGSHRWDWERRADPEQMTFAEMPAGSVLLYTGSVLHSGGANNSDSARLGLNITYCLGWLRQEENQYLSCPPHIAKDLEPGLQELLGYTQGNYALGYFSDPESSEPGFEIVPPERALGRMPRKGAGFSLSDSSNQGRATATQSALSQQDV